MSSRGLAKEVTAFKFTCRCGQTALTEIPYLPAGWAFRYGRDEVVRGVKCPDCDAQYLHESRWK